MWSIGGAVLASVCGVALVACSASSSGGSGAPVTDLRGMQAITPVRHEPPPGSGWAPCTEGPDGYCPNGASCWVGAGPQPNSGGLASYGCCPSGATSQTVGNDGITTFGNQTCLTSTACLFSQSDCPAVTGYAVECSVENLCVYQSVAPSAGPCPSSDPTDCGAKGCCRSGSQCCSAGQCCPNGSACCGDGKTCCPSGYRCSGEGDCISDGADGG
jgi:hypothetical protein